MLGRVLEENWKGLWLNLLLAHEADCVGPGQPLWPAYAVGLRTIWRKNDICRRNGLIERHPTLLWPKVPSSSLGNTWRFGGLEQGNVRRREGLQWDIMVQSPPSKMALFTRWCDLCCLEITCNSRRSLATSWKSATQLTGENFIK